jgi:ubiquinone/menaquinone biosynthesis C-methylase UbiE
MRWNGIVPDYWNHNVYYQPLILNAVPDKCGSALDVGCGDGMLACRLAARCRDVIGIDRDSHMIRLARERGQDIPNVAFLGADFLTYPFDEASFDFVACNTAIHHMDFEAAIEAMAGLLRPGGQLAIVGLARNATVSNWLDGASALPLNWALEAAHGALRAVGREVPGPGQPVTNPSMSWEEVRVTALRLLPRARYRKHLLFRYSLVWRKPS